MLKRFMMLAALCGAFATAVTLPQVAFAAEGEARSKSGWPKTTRSVRPGEKVCKMKFSDGERVSWICKKEEPCCEWEALNKYVKCGSTIAGCL